MTPPGATAAAERSKRRSRAARPAVAPRHPRRVSGPARPRPAHPGSSPRRGRARRGAFLGVLLARVLDRARTLPDARVVDRLVRGPAWIVLIGFLLMGLVAIQVSQLKLGASVSRAVQQSANLERRNGELKAAVSRLSGEQRLHGAGTRLGMFMPAAGAIRFLTLSPPRDATQAANALRANRQPAPVSGAGAVSAAPADTAPDPDRTAAPPAPADAAPPAQAPSPGGTPAPPTPAPAPVAPVDTAATGAASAPATSGPDGQG